MGMGKKTMRRIHGMMFKLPLMIACDEFEEFILAYIEDELPPKQRFVFEMHLKVCRECREYLRAYRASMDLARHADDALPATVPEDLVEAVLAAHKA